MADYNLDLEKALRYRPIPGKQAAVSVESIITPASRKSPIRRSVIGIAVCAVAAIVLMIAGNALQEGAGSRNMHLNQKQTADAERDSEQGIEGSEATSSLNLTDEEWNGLFNGTASDLGIEVLHREQITENRQLLFMVMDSGEPYRYRLIHAEFEKDKDNQYRKTRLVQSSPLTKGADPTMEAGNDWMTYNRNILGEQKDEPQVQVAFGYILNSRVAEVRLTDDKGVREQANILMDSKGQRFWYTLLSAEMQGGFYLGAMNSSSQALIKMDSEEREKVARSSSIHDLTSEEWQDLYNGKMVDSAMEVLQTEELDSNHWTMFIVNNNRTSFQLAPRIAVTTLRKEGDLYLPSTLSVSASNEDKGASRIANDWFNREWSISRTDNDPSIVHIFGSILDSKVASIRLTNHKGEHKTVDLLHNKKGESFFFSFIPNEWIKRGELFYTEALDEDGASLYLEEERLSSDLLE